MAAAAPIFTAAGAAVPCSAFRRGAGRHAAAREAAAAAREACVDDGSALAAAPTPLPVANAPLTQRVVAEYIYLGGSGTDMRSVTRVVEVPRGAEGDARAPDSLLVAALPLIAVDGAATRQAGSNGNVHCSALFLKPRSAWLDPLRGGGALMVLCEAYSPPALGGTGDAKVVEATAKNSTQQLHPAPLSPHPTNNRAFAERAARAACREEPLFAVTQQYLLCEGDGRPLGWTADGPPQASCYGSPEATGFFPPWNGTGTSAPPSPSPSSSPSPASDDASAPSRKGRAVADAHLAACLAAGLAVTGCRAERASGQWSFSMGPLPPLEAADQLWAARWLLRAVAASTARLAAVTDALPRHLSKFEGAWDGNGCRVKFSTRATRDASGGGRGALRDAIERLAAAHASHMMVYGAGAALRCERAGKRRGTAEAAREAEESEKSPSPPPSPTTPTEASPGPSPLAPRPRQHQHRFAGVEDTGAFLRVPAAVALHGRGHLEDRRPAGGCDPYLALTLLLCTTLGLPLPLASSSGGDSSLTANNNAKGAAAAKRARSGDEQDDGATLVARQRRRTAAAAPLASAAASGSVENRCCPNAQTQERNNTNAPPAAASFLACDEQVAESAQEGGENNAAAAVAPETSSDLDSDSHGARSSALLLAEDEAGDDDEEDDDDEGVSTPLTPSRDAADGGATTVAGPDNRREASSGRDLDDDATSSSSNGGGN